MLIYAMNFAVPVSLSRIGSSHKVLVVHPKTFHLLQQVGQMAYRMYGLSLLGTSAVYMVS